VVDVKVQPGDHVSRGDVLVMLEAMKMELPVRAPRDGVVKSIAHRVGDLVQPGNPLLDLD
jgi:biotin carboxyl carrier protein